MTIHHHGHPELGADSIRTGHQDRLLVPAGIKGKKTAEAPYLSQDFRPESAAHGVTHQVYGLIARIYVYPGIRIGHSLLVPGHH
jgi:hypothetical protein